MGKKKDKNYRRQIEVLKAQLSSQVTLKEVLPANDKLVIGKNPSPTSDISYTTVEVVKKEVIKSLLLSLVCFSIIIAAYILQK